MMDPWMSLCRAMDSLVRATDGPDARRKAARLLAARWQALSETCSGSTSRAALLSWLQHFERQPRWLDPMARQVLMIWDWIASTRGTIPWRLMLPPNRVEVLDPDQPPDPTSGIDVAPWMPDWPEEFDCYARMEREWVQDQIAALPTAADRKQARQEVKEYLQRQREIADTYEPRKGGLKRQKADDTAEALVMWRLGLCGMTELLSKRNCDQRNAERLMATLEERATAWLTPPAPQTGAPEVVTGSPLTPEELTEYGGDAPLRPA